MIEIVWQCVVNEAARGRFELTFGPGGAWGKLYAHRPGFRGLTLLRDTRDPRRYLVIEVWDAPDQREQALAEGATAVTELEAGLAEWSEPRQELGVFRVQAEAVVRPLSHSRRGKAGMNRNRGILCARLK